MARGTVNQFYGFKPMRWVGKILSLCLGSAAASASSGQAVIHGQDTASQPAISRLNEIREAYLVSIRSREPCDQSGSEREVETGWQQVQWQNFPNFGNFPNFPNFGNFPNFPNFPNWFNGWMNY